MASHAELRVRSSGREPSSKSEERQSSYASVRGCRRDSQMGGTEGPVGATDRRTHTQAYDDCWRTVGCRWWYGGCWASDGARKQLETTAASLSELAATSEEGYVLTGTMGGREVLSTPPPPPPGEAWEYL